MTKRKVKFSEDTEGGEERPTAKSRRFKVQDLDNDGRWVEVQLHPMLPDVFTCNTCEKSLSARTTAMRHMHWCLFDEEHEPSSPEATHVHTKSSKDETKTKNNSENTSMKIEDKTDGESECSNGLPGVIVCTPTSAEHKHRGGAATRRKYTNIEKVQIINEVNNGGKPSVVAYKYGINRSLISKWNSKKDFLMEVVATPEKGNDTKNRRKFKYAKLFAELHNRYLKAKEEGMEVNHRWVYNCANEIIKESNPEAAALPPSVASNFAKQYGIQFPPKVKSENTPVKERPINFHASSEENTHIVFVSSDTSAAGTIEQVPLSFAIDLKHNYENEPIQKQSQQSQPATTVVPSFPIDLKRNYENEQIQKQSQQSQPATTVVPMLFSEDHVQGIATQLK